MKQFEITKRERTLRRFSDEFNLVIQCSQVQYNEENKMAISRLVKKGMDWKQFLYLVDRHKVCPTVYRTLNSIELTDLPSRVLEELRAKARRATMNSLSMVAELITIIREMEKMKLRSIVLKGYPLGAQLYGDFTLRPSVDLDIFVLPEEVELAKRVMEKHGFQLISPAFELTPARLKNWIQTRHHFDYWHTGKRINVELHWRMGHSDMEIPLNDITENLSEVRMSGHAFSTVREEVLLVYLVMHGASHGWSELKWVQDIVLLLERGNICWTKVFNLSDRLGVSSLIHQAILIAYWTSGITVDEAVKKRCNEDKRGQNLAEMALRFLAATHQNPLEGSVYSSIYYHRKWYDFTMQYGWKRKIRLLGNCLRPVEEDIDTVSLPDRFYSLYYMIRPLSWVKRRVGQMLRG